MNTRKLRVPGRGLFEAGLVLAFLLVCAFNLWHHEMWRDEMQPWLFARDSASIAELFKNLHYETHPRLWYLILYGVARISSNPAAMQVTHLLIIGSAITLLVLFAPLPLYLKALTVFGYFFVYEWGAISRNYALGVLCCFAFCARFPRRDKGYLGLAAILFLVTQSNQYAALLAAGLGGVLILEACMKPEVRSRIRAHKLDAALSLLLLLGGVCLSFWIGVPQRDVTESNFTLTTFDWVQKLQHAFAAVWDGFVPWPGLNPLNAWGYNKYSPAFHFLGYQAIVGMILFPITVLFFRRSRLILRAYLVGFIGLVLLTFVQTASSLRHAGHFFLWFLLCLWLAHYFPVSNGSDNTKPFGLSPPQKLFVCLLLLFHIYAGVFLSIADYCHDFSCGKAVARYLEEHNSQGLPVVSMPDSAGITVSGYSGLRIYYPDSDRWLRGSFVIENNKRRTNLTHNEIIQLTNEFAAQSKQDFLLLVAGDVVHEILPLGNLEKEATFIPAICDESYALYRYERGSQGHPGETIARRREALRVNPADADAHNNLGIVLLQQGCVEEAMAQFREAFQIKPDFALARNNLGDVLLQQGRTEEALAQYREVLRIKPAYVDTHNNDLGSVLLQQGREEEAMAQFHTALQLNPAFSIAHYNLGVALFQLGRTEEAIDHFRKALQLNPAYSQADNNLGIALLRQGKAEEAIAHLREALQIDPGYADARYNLGNALLQQGKAEEAIAQYREALRINPADVDAHSNLGNALLQQRRVEEAIIQYREALQINPAYADARNNLGNVLLQQGRSEEAIANFHEALQINPADKKAHFNLGNVLFGQGRMEEAITQYREVLQIDPSVAAAHYKLGSALYQLGRAEEAIGHLQKALELQPAIGDIQNSLAWMLATAPQSSLRKGVRAIQLATQANQSSGGNNPVILRTLAAAYAAAGDFPYAVQTAQHALQLAEAQSNTDLASNLRREITLYEAGLPYREGQ